MNGRRSLYQKKLKLKKKNKNGKRNGHEKKPKSRRELPLHLLRCQSRNQCWRIGRITQVLLRQCEYSARPGLSLNSRGFRSTPVTAAAEPEWQVATSKVSEAAKVAQEAANSKKNKVGFEIFQSEIIQYVQKNKKKAVEEINPVTTTEKAVSAPAPVESSAASAPTKSSKPTTLAEAVPEPEPLKDAYQEKMDAVRVS